MKPWDFAEREIASNHKSVFESHMYDPGAPQLVGMSCTLCEKTIGSIAAGKFCSLCACPVHHKCVKQNTLRRREECRECGTTQKKKETVIEAEREVVQDLERDVRHYYAVRSIMMGMASIVTGAGATVFCTALMGGGTIIVASGLIVFGIGQVLLGFVRLMQRGPRNPSSPDA